jgi:ribose 5-phosphate isomerase
VRDNTCIGVGSGSTIVYAVERLAERVASGNSFCGVCVCVCVCIFQLGWCYLPGVKRCPPPDMPDTPTNSTHALRCFLAPHTENLSVQCVPTSFQATQLLTNAKIPITNLSNAPLLDVAIDGADEVRAAHMHS